MKGKKRKEAAVEDILAGFDALFEGEDIQLDDVPPVPDGDEDVDEPVTLGVSIPSSGHTATAFGRNTSSIYTLEAGQLCPRCNYSYLEHATSFLDKECEFFVYCQTCNAYICTYKPMPHQEEFHRDERLRKLYAGGFGSAKTYTCGMEFLCTVLQIPNSAGLIGAATWGQVADTCLKFLLDNLPKGLVLKSNQDKVSWYVDLINGSRISAKTLDNEGKIRSANLSIIWVEEASEVKYSVVSYIQARLRNKVAYFKGKSRMKMLLSSNPDVNWLATDQLMTSCEIIYHGDVAERNYKVPPERQDPANVTHIAATSANVYLPPDYETNLAKNKPQWWINRYLKGSFKYTEGLVYPEYNDWFVEPFPIPQHWNRITGTDFGRHDPTAHVIGALDPVKMIIYVYAELEESLDDKPVSYMAEKIKKLNNYPGYLRPYGHMCDPRGRARDQTSGNSWIKAYAELGLLLSPAPGCEKDSLAPTIQKLATYAAHGRIKFFRSCKAINLAFSKYKYPARDLGEEGNQGETPLDSNNHLPDAIRYMMSVFPNFPASPGDFGDVWHQTLKKVQHGTTDFYSDLGSYEDSSDEVVEFMDNFG